MQQPAVEWIEEKPRLLGTVGAVTGQLGQLSKSDVLGLQAQMNVDNRCIGSPQAPLVEDGIPGDATCEMAKFLNTRSGTAWDGSICPGGGPVGSYPADTLCAMAAARRQAPPEPPGPPPGELPVSSTSLAGKKTSPWLWAALGVAVVVGGVIVMRGGRLS